MDDCISSTACAAGVRFLGYYIGMCGAGVAQAEAANFDFVLSGQMWSLAA